MTLAALCLGASAATAQDLPPQAPQLRIDPGMHTAQIKRIGVDAACTLLATGSDDKTVRLWRLPEGKLLQTLRPPIGPGNDGKVNAVAVAPDGGWVAAGGWDAQWSLSQHHFLYIFQTASGRVMARLGPLGAVINHIAISQDGRFLAAALGVGDGVRVWQRSGASLEAWRLVAADSDYGGRDSYGVAFDRSGALYTVADDGNLRRYAPGYTAKPAVIATRGGKEPYSVAAHPIGDRVAVGFYDTSAVEVYTATTLAWRFAADTKGVEDSLANVVWSADGKRLYAGGTYNKDGHPLIRIWDRSGEGSARELEGPLDTIRHLLSCGDGLAMGASDPAFGLFAADGSRRLWQDSVQADLRDKRFDHFTVSADGRRARFGLKQLSDEPVLFDLVAERLAEAPHRQQDLHAADTQSLPVTDWINDRGPKLAGTTIKMDRYEIARSLAVAPDKQRFILGTEWWLRAYDKDGRLLWRRPVPGAAWGVNIPRDGNVVIAAYADGTVRWHRLSDGQELLALFVHAKDRRWVLWTPKGYYTSSPGGDSLIGWHVNRGWNEAADFFPVSKYREAFYRPDIVARMLSDLDEEKAITQANLAINKKREDEDVRKQQPPVIRILSLPRHAGEEVTIDYSLRSPAGLPVKRVFAQIDGRPVAGAETMGLVPDARQEITGRLRVKVPPRDATLSLFAETESTASEPASVDLLWVGGRAQPTVKPRLYALVIGVGAYTDPALRLNFPANDADDLAAQLKKQEGATFETVEIRELKDRVAGAEATLHNIKAGLSWLRQMARDSNDVALVYFSGHGVSVTGATSYLLPVDYDGDVDVTGLDKTAMINTLRRIDGRVIFFADACFAADGLNIASIPGARRLNTSLLVSEFADSQNGIIAFASSTGSERSYGTGRNSYFTKAIIEGLLGHAARGGKEIMTDDLQVWLRDRVPAVSEGRQTPVMMMSQQARPVALAGVR